MREALRISFLHKTGNRYLAITLEKRVCEGLLLASLWLQLPDSNIPCDLEQLPVG